MYEKKTLNCSIIFRLCVNIFNGKFHCHWFCSIQIKLALNQINPKNERMKPIHTHYVGKPHSPRSKLHITMKRNATSSIGNRDITYDFKYEKNIVTMFVSYTWIAVNNFNILLDERFYSNLNKCNKFNHNQFIV